MISLLNAILTFLKNTNPVVLTLFTASSAAVTVWKLFAGLWPELYARVDSLAVSASGGAISFAPCALLNSVFPLSELLNFLVAYGALRVACAAIRIIKSFVPTIA